MIRSVETHLSESNSIKAATLQCTLNTLGSFHFQNFQANLAKETKISATMDPNYQFPTSATYVITTTQHGPELQLKSTLKAFNNHIRQPACALLEESTVNKITALRLTTKVSQSNQDAENRQYMFLVINTITNYTNDLVRVVTFDVNVDVESISTLLKACKGLELLVFNQAQVNRLNKFLLKDAPGHLLPMGHRLKKVVFDRVSFPHVMKMIEALQKTVSKDISPSYHIIDLYLTASDLPAIQRMADSFLNDTWGPSIRFDMVATATFPPRKNRESFHDRPWWKCRSA